MADLITIIYTVHIHLFIIIKVIKHLIFVSLSLYQKEHDLYDLLHNGTLSNTKKGQIFLILYYMQNNQLP